MKNLFTAIKLLFFGLIAFTLIQCGTKKNHDRDEIANNAESGLNDSILIRFEKLAHPILDDSIVYITLLVDTENIKPGNPNSAREYSMFAGQPSDVEDEDFTTIVNAGDSVVWLGFSLNAPLEHIVSIERTIFKQGNEIIKPNSTGNGNHRAWGKVKKEFNQQGPIDAKYIIKFKVHKDGSVFPPTGPMFSIDPKLQIVR